MGGTFVGGGDLKMEPPLKVDRTKGGDSGLRSPRRTLTNESRNWLLEGISGITRSGDISSERGGGGNPETTTQARGIPASSSTTSNEKGRTSQRSSEEGIVETKLPR